MDQRIGDFSAVIILRACALPFSVVKGFLPISGCMMMGAGLNS